MHRQPGHRFWPTGKQHRGFGDIACLLTVLGDAAQNDLGHECGVQLVTLRKRLIQRLQ